MARIRSVKPFEPPPWPCDPQVEWQFRRAGASFVYRMFDVEDTLLYVGITTVGRERIMHHLRRPWGQEVVAIDWEWFATRNEAADEERLAIAFEGPVHNIVRPSRERLQRMGAI